MHSLELENIQIRDSTTKYNVCHNISVVICYNFKRYFSGNLQDYKWLCHIAYMLMINAWEFLFCPHSFLCSSGHVTYCHRLVSVRKLFTISFSDATEPFERILCRSYLWIIIETWSSFHFYSPSNMTIMGQNNFRFAEIWNKRSAQKPLGHLNCGNEL